MYEVGHPIVVGQAAVAVQCALRSRQVSRIRAAAVECNSRSRAVAAKGGSTHDRGGGNVVGCVLDAISILYETGKSDAQRHDGDATSTQGCGDHAWARGVEAGTFGCSG